MSYFRRGRHRRNKFGVTVAELVAECAPKLTDPAERGSLYWRGPIRNGNVDTFVLTPLEAVTA